MKKAATEPFVMLQRSLIQSDAWRAAGINTRRFIDFLLLEHMAHGGKANGKLKAPRRQLWEFGISARHVTAAINEAEELGLVDCHRGGMRVATTYTVTWLPLHDSTAAIRPMARIPMQPIRGGGHCNRTAAIKLQFWYPKGYQPSIRRDIRWPESGIRRDIRLTPKPGIRRDTPL